MVTDQSAGIHNQTGVQELSCPEGKLECRSIVVAGTVYKFVKIPEPIDDSQFLDMCGKCGCKPLPTDVLTIDLAREIERVSGWWAGRVEPHPARGFEHYYQFVSWCSFIFQLRFFESYLGGSFAAVIDHKDFSVWLMVESA